MTKNPQEMNSESAIMNDKNLPVIGGMAWSDFVDHVSGFHGYAAPGVLLGGIMVEIARDEVKRFQGDDVLFDAIAEAGSCLPDAVQLLTACTTGNGWLKVVDLSRYALTFYNKRNGEGVRVYVDGEKLKAYPNFHDWFMNLVDKKDQDENQLREEIRVGGAKVLGISRVSVDPKYLHKKRKGLVVNCPACGEPYPKRDGAVCLGCQGQSPITADSARERRDAALPAPALKAVPTEEAIGKHALHDMTQIIPGESKGPRFKAGQKIDAGDLCRLQQMGRNHVYLEESLAEVAGTGDWVHENDAALAFGKAMRGDGVAHDDKASEGKVRFLADRDGLFVLDERRLEAFNTVNGVMCAARHGFSVVEKGMDLAATRAIPLYLPARAFANALSVLGDEPLFRVLPMRKARAGVLVTGTEVFRGIIEDKFTDIMLAKVKQYGGEMVYSEIVPDEPDMIRAGVENCLKAGADIIITTAGLSVDPDDVTRKALVEAGMESYIFGAPVLPGSMTLVGRIGDTQVIGVPACALYHRITAFDLLYPRLLAGLTLTRADMARLGHGGLCLNCKPCTYPHCGFGK